MAAKKKPAAKSRKSVIGRPPSYNAKFHPNMARILASQGLSDEDIAREIGIAVSTYYKWKKEKPAFSEAIKKAKEDPDSRIENALYKKALGYTVETRREIAVALGNNQGSELQSARVQQHIPSSDTAMIFWLKNRRPDRWRDKQEIEHSGGLVFTAPEDLDD